jgi:C_GCAxxG_C_C family probable redox protein
MLFETEKENMLDRVAKMAGDYREEVSSSCCQGTLAALQEEFNLGGGKEIIKAATFMSGIASRNETCGAITGGLLALGLKFGTDKIKDSEPGMPEGKTEIFELRETEMFKFREKAWRFCEEFKKEFGSTMCGDIRPQIMGRNYNSMDPVDRQQFLNDGGRKKCRVPVEKAARIAALIIMEDS